ncbi:hypothetical protein HPB50_023004 [Hyalomma asiaticum]|uniref:Uncharacterized protein n=1 Tax=Hyalomma asiaticum TaxID=266040 RepID=A0ACB7T1C3_HYAAI|nr:hypothetical protein HPB50_023004 [Hyalomma asiaticum]
MVAKATSRCPPRRRAVTDARRCTGGGRAPGFSGRVLEVTGTTQVAGLQVGLPYQEVSTLPENLGDGASEFVIMYRTDSRKGTLSIKVMVLGATMTLSPHTEAVIHTVAKGFKVKDRNHERWRSGPRSSSGRRAARLFTRQQPRDLPVRKTVKHR